MAKSFNLLNILGDNKKVAETLEDATFKIEYIDIDLIEPSKKNFYTVDDIEELKESILLYGLQQNIVVKKLNDSVKYELISGERRYTALKTLVGEGRKEFKKVPAKVEYMLDDLKSELLLIFANSTTRVLTDYEKVQQATKLKELLQELKKRGVKLPGRMRQIVADTLDVSLTQVGRMESINNNLSKEFKEELKEDNINISTASELATLPAKKQEEVYKEFKDKGNLKLEDVKKHKEEVKNKGVKNIGKTKSINNCICVYCGYVFNGFLATNGNINCGHVHCNSCDKDMKVSLKVEYTCYPLDNK